MFCRACEKEVQKSGKTFDKSLVIGHWEHEIHCPLVQSGKSLCHSKWLPCKEKFLHVKFMPPTSGKRTKDWQSVKFVKKGSTKANSKKAGPWKVQMVNSLGDGAEEPEF